MRKGAAALIVVIVRVLALLAFLRYPILHSTGTISKTTVTDTFAMTVIVLSTESSISCGYVVPAPCPSSQAFALSVNYSGSWSVAYQGYNAAACANCYNNSTRTLSGGFNGSGPHQRKRGRPSKWLDDLRSGSED